jgi:hypothetical protein
MRWQSLLSTKRTALGIHTGNEGVKPGETDPEKAKDSGHNLHNP